MTVADIERIHAEVKRDYEDDCAFRGVLFGSLIGAGMWLGLYGFIRAFVWAVGR